MHKVLVNRLGGLSLPRKSVVRLTDRPDMTLDVYRGRKTTIQQYNNNPYHFKRIVFRYKNTGYNINVLRQTACLVVDPIKVDNFAYLFDCTTIGRASD